MNSAYKPPHVIMFGPDLNVKGGIAFVVREYFAAGLQNQIKLRFIPTTRDGSKTAKIFYFLFAFIKALSAFSKYPHCICHLHTSQDGSFYRKFMVLCLAKLFRKKVIVHIHGSKFEEFMSTHSLNRLLTRIMFSKADLVIVLSDSFKSKIEDFCYDATVITVFNPVRKLSRVNDSYKEGLQVLFLGRLSKRKGTYDLIDAISDNKELFTENKVKFVIAGDGDIDKVQTIADRHGLNKIVDLPGWVSGEEKMNLLMSADIFVLPSYNEQMPMSILEAMSIGLPIISTIVAGIPEMVEDGRNGILIKPGDRNGLSKALVELVHNHDRRILMGNSSLNIVSQKFDSQIVLNKLKSIYNSLENL